MIPSIRARTLSQRIPHRRGYTERFYLLQDQIQAKVINGDRDQNSDDL